LKLVVKTEPKKKKYRPREVILTHRDRGQRDELAIKCGGGAGISRTLNLKGADGLMERL